MKIGAVYEGDVEIWSVEIEGRGGDSVHDEYFLEQRDAVFASAADEQNRAPQKIKAMKFSDGSYLKGVNPIHVQETFNLDSEAKAKIIGSLSPAQKILLGVG